MSFVFKESHLRRLFELNFFPVPTDGMVFFGLRGCLSIDADNCEFDTEHNLEVASVDYTRPRCVLGQWKPKDKVIAIFPGSTVPHRTYIKKALLANGVGANQMVTGYFDDYRKGTHKPGKQTAHEAFRQTKARPIRRSGDDYDYENDDRVEFANPFDNFHAAWCKSVTSDIYHSAGCQVVVGTPKCSLANHKKDVGAWAVFKKNAYDISAQMSFPYALFTGVDAQKVALNDGKKLTVRLRYGSKDALVKKIQAALQEDDFYEGILDDDFGDRTLRAVMDYQTARFGPLQDDGIVGPTTASALGVKWVEK
jgi:hypothetical protein